VIPESDAQRKRARAPPCHVNDPDNPVREERKAARLQQRMLRAGVSKWHPDPLAAIAEAKQQSAGRRS
jgi:hypothetical protein